MLTLFNSCVCTEVTWCTVYSVVYVGGALLKRGTVPHTFVVSHFQGTNPVQYNVSGWLKACRENPVLRSSAAVLQESKWSVLVMVILTFLSF